jgi:hypothetical protein
MVTVGLRKRVRESNGGLRPLWGWWRRGWLACCLESSGAAEGGGRRGSRVLAAARGARGSRKDPGPEQNLVIGILEV